MLCRARLSPGDRSLSGVCTLVSLWVQEGCVEGLPRHQSCELPDPWSGVGRTRDAVDRPGCRAGDSPQVPWAREEPTEEAAPRTPLPGLFAAPPSLTLQHDEDTRSLVYFVPVLITKEAQDWGRGGRTPLK